MDEKTNELYIKKDTLSIRIHLHEKYSVNKYGWHNWVFDQYEIKENMKILELGCGTGNSWYNKKENLPQKTEVILTDISPIMLEKVKNCLGNTPFSFQVMDIQDIPFEDDCFDIIIANHILYHVPDMNKALSEVKRVLKKDGYFYTTTIGENNLKELQDIYTIFKNKITFMYSKDCSFVLENGELILEKYFSRIDKKLYIDSLEVKDIEDVMDYIVSYNKIPQEYYYLIYKEIKNKFNENGIFHIQKSQGMFICQK